MREDAVFAGKHSLIPGHGLHVVNVAVDGRGATEVVHLGDALLTHGTLIQSFSVGQRWRVGIEFPGQDVMRSRVTVIDCCDLRWLRCPWIRGLCILLILRLFHHAVEEALEGALIARRLRTNMVRGAPRETLRSHAQSTPIKGAILFQAELESVLRSAMRHLACRNFGKVLLQRDSPALTVHIENSVSFREVLIDLGWINTSIALLGVHEAFERTHRLGL